MRDSLFSRLVFDILAQRLSMSLSAPQGRKDPALVSQRVIIWDGPGRGNDVFVSVDDLRGVVQFELEPLLCLFDGQAQIVG